MIRNFFKTLSYKFQPYNTYFRYAYYYYNFFEKYENYKTLLSFLHSDNFEKFARINVKIFFKGVISFGMQKNEVKKWIGKPIWVFQGSSIENHEVYFYKWIIGQYKTKAELHFLNGLFFMGTYSFDGYTQTDYIKITNLFFEKYKINDNNINYQKLAFKDMCNNFILLDNNEQGLSLTYFTGEKNIMHYLLDQSQVLETKLKEKEELIKRKIMASL